MSWDDDGKWQEGGDVMWNMEVGGFGEGVKVPYYPREERNKERETEEMLFVSMSSGKQLR